MNDSSTSSGLPGSAGGTCGVSVSTLWPSALEQLGGVAGVLLHVRVDLLLDEGLDRQPDPQLAGVGADLLGVGPLGRRREVGIAGHAAVDGLEDRRRVAHRRG